VRVPAEAHRRRRDPVPARAPLRKRGAPELRPGGDRLRAHHFPAAWRMYGRDAVSGAERPYVGAGYPLRCSEALADRRALDGSAIEVDYFGRTLSPLLRIARSSRGRQTTVRCQFTRAVAPMLSGPAARPPSRRSGQITARLHVPRWIGAARAGLVAVVWAEMRHIVAEDLPPAPWSNSFHVAGDGNTVIR